MAMNIQMRSGKAQLRVRHALLPRPFFATFPSEFEAREYGEKLEALLDRGIVPEELARTSERKQADPLLIEIIREYSKGAPVAATDHEVLDVVAREVAGVRLSELTFVWCDAYVLNLKIAHNLAPGTIRKRVGSLARAVDWYLRRAAVGGVMAANPLRLLPRGYSTYTAADIEAGATRKRDKYRDRRLSGDESRRIESALAGERRVGRERALEVDPAFSLLYALIVDTGLRLSEAFRLRVDSVDLRRGILDVEGSKGHHGAIKPRVVPLKPALRERLRQWCAGRVGLVFPFWDGSEADKDLASGRLTSRFRVLFDYAEVDGFTQHDLRHEATCRWVEMRNATGWVFSETEVCKIMGWSDTRMMLRYASLRGEDLAARLA